MEEFGWVLIIAVVWVLSTIKEFREAQRKKQRREERPEERTTSRRREPEHVQTGPRAGQRDLARDLDEGARRAEEALHRWEARQRVAGELPGAEHRTAERDAGRVPAARPAPTARRPSVSDERREAYTAIAEMLAGRRPEPPAPMERPVPVEGERSREIFDEPEAPDVPEWIERRPVRRPSEHRPPEHQPPVHGALVSLRSSRAPSPAGRPVGARAPSGGSSLPSLARLAPLQQAIVWSEILGPPVALRDQGLTDR